MNFSWYWKRVKHMGYWEVCIYRPAQLIKKKLIDRFFPNRNLFEKISCNKKFALPEYDKQFLDLLFKRYRFTNKFNLFGSCKVDLSEKINWRKDYKTNTVSPLKFYADINRQDYRTHGDIKYVAELSRMYFLPFIAFHSVISGERDGKQIKDILSTWIKQNPFYRSIHWTSGIEVSIRSINIIYCHLILRVFGLLNSKVDGLIKEHIRYNYCFLKSNLSKYSSANNHLIAELAGLVIISTYFDNERLRKERSKWEKNLYKELFSQTSEDGVSNEKSFRYHAEVTDHFLNAFVFLERSGIEIPDRVTERLKKMLVFINDLTYKGNVNEFGDGDDGHLIFPFFDNDFSLYQSLLSSTLIKYDIECDESVRLDLRNYLIFGETADEVLNGEASRQLTKRDKLYEKGGFCFLYHRDAKTKVSFDVGEIGDNITAAHGHSDLLHFTFETAGKLFIVDPGTFQYHQECLFWRNYFRGISAHNTISVNGMNHAKMSTRMGWIKKPSIWITNFKSNNNRGVCEAVHSGFSRSYEEYLHKRKVILDRTAQCTTVIDYLSEREGGESLATYFLHFHPSVGIQKKGNEIELYRDKVKVSLHNNYFGDAKILSGNESKPFGWFSPSYDYKMPSQSLFLKLKFSEKIKLETKIYY